MYYPDSGALRWQLGYMGTYSPDRQPGLVTLLLAPARRQAENRFVVAGPNFPDTEQWPSNVQWIDHLPPAVTAASTMHSVLR